ncbi:hybrid sensor histidine kinase/response regulator [Rubricoccus marinus]|uniref:histidine kinase n=1 Tax=Rubricoccus marinus TaxID=716817 RepID=A0A259TYR2_9BACT|nr:ATP-binding protein [Rubricoccus marinus]OZC02718.1 hypothetical protein BSZ36_06870 [Rubricoccus marinus]
MEVATPATASAAPLPLIAADLVTATVTATCDCLDANEAWRQLFGMDGLWARLPAKDARFAANYITEAARGQMVSQQVFLVEPLPGADLPTPVLLNFHPVRLPGTSVGRYPVLISGEILREPVSWAQEQTRRRRMEVVGQMTMGVAHDFNNLLTTVLGHAELLRNELGDLPSSALDSLRSLTRAAKDGAALVKKIQAYLRHEKRERFETVDLASLVGEVVTLTRPYWYNEPRRQGIAIELDADLAPVPPIQGYSTELREVLVNLVLNAVQAMPAGGSISLTTIRDPHRNAAVVEVGDSGVGMPPRVLRRIFEPLYTTKGSNGTGMGLAVAQGIMQEHGGRIEVESTPGNGSVFRLVLPFAPEAPIPDRPAPKVRMATQPPMPTTSLRLLIVDDEPMVRTITSRLLSLRGHAIEAVHGGIAALEALASGAYDCVVTDLSMPEMSGRELAAHVRERHPALPVVLLTGDTDPDADSDHIAAVVRKPFEASNLDDVVRRVVEAHAASL